MTLPPYSTEATCPKCGHNDVGVSYRPRGCSYPARCGVSSPFGSEHLDRFCRRCHYDWAEACIESPSPERKP